MKPAKSNLSSVRTCPHCGGDGSVTDTRDRNGRLKRTRRCDKCAKRWQTVEVHASIWDNIATAAVRLGAAAIAVEVAKRTVEALERPPQDEIDPIEGKMARIV